MVAEVRVSVPALLGSPPVVPPLRRGDGDCAGGGRGLGSLPCRGGGGLGWGLAPLWSPRCDGGTGVGPGGGEGWGGGHGGSIMYYTHMKYRRRRRWRAAAATQERAKILRRELTHAEQRLWQRLRGRQLNGAYFRRQHAVGPFIVDFCCVQARLVIEVDGHTHAAQGEYDAERTRWLTDRRGYHVLRFPNAAVEHHLDAVVDSILAALEG